MYAEERQQAMAHLISRRGRLSVVQLAGEFEVTTDVIDGPQSAVFLQGHNRMHAARAALAFVLRGPR